MPSSASSQRFSLSESSTVLTVPHSARTFEWRAAEAEVAGGFAGARMERIR